MWQGSKETVGSPDHNLTLAQRIEFESSARTAFALNLCAISPVLQIFFEDSILFLCGYHFSVNMLGTSETLGTKRLSTVVL